MGTAEILASNKREVLKGKSIFQPAEEGPPEGEDGGCRINGSPKKAMPRKPKLT
jgi:hypothetical protein